MLPGNSDIVGWDGAWEFPLKNVSRDDYNTYQHLGIIVHILIIFYTRMFNESQKNHPPPQSPVCNIAEKSNWSVLREYKLTLTLS